MTAVKKERNPKMTVKNINVTVTKKQMVEQIQTSEARAWKEFQEAKQLWGQDDPITTRRRTTWSTMYSLREALGIPAMDVESLIKKDLIPAYAIRHIAIDPKGFDGGWVAPLTTGVGVGVVYGVQRGGE